MKNIRSVLTGLFMGIAAIGFSMTSAQAILIDNGLTTLDTDQNLIWLDLTESTNRSYAHVAGQFGAGGDFEGRRHATTIEVTALFTNAGFPPSYFIPSVSTPLAQFIALFGPTLAPNLLQGYYDDDATSGDRFVAEALIFSGGSFAGILTDATDLPSPIIGNWLVQSAAIPEPGTFVILGLGLAGIGFARRKRAA